MITVAVIEDHRLVAESLRRILDTSENIKCVGVANDGIRGLELIRSVHPDVAIVDINMPGMDGIELTTTAKAEFPNLKVLILTAYDYDEYVIASLQAGADGYVLKANLPCDELVNAVRMIHTGPAVLDHQALISLKKLAEGREAIPPDVSISPREKEILRYATKGITSKQIASALNLSELTVNTHFTNIFRKLGVQSRMEAVMLALRKGWIRADNIAASDSKEASDDA